MTKKNQKNPKSAPSAEKRSRGPVEKKINWDEVISLCQAGCYGTEVAAHQGVHFDTLATRCKEKYGIKFSEFSNTLTEKGKSLLRHKQFQLALKGDRGMLIWLGKNKLNQRDKPKEDESDKPTLEQFVKIMEMLKKVQND